MPNYPDVEQLLIDWLKADPQSWVNVTDELPTNLVGTLRNGPCIIVTRFGGADIHHGLDVAHITVDVYALGRGPAKTSAETIRRSITLTLPGRVIGGAAVSRVATIAAPTVRPFDSATIRYVGASYQLHLHRAI